jgi:hypothetical protein
LFYILGRLTLEICLVKCNAQIYGNHIRVSLVRNREQVTVQV